jgi:segregation and condensation protein B
MSEETAQSDASASAGSENQAQDTEEKPSSPEATEAVQATEEPAAVVVVDEKLPQKIEAVLMSTDRPMPSARLVDVLGAPGVRVIKEAVAGLNKVYEETGRSFRIEAVAEGWQILTLPEFGSVLESLHKVREQTRLSPAALEALAIVAYKQPILRADIEAIRGVACGEVLNNLMGKHLVKIVGHAEEVGRPRLYGTTKTFLRLFGLSNLADLPKVEELKLKKDA